MGSPLSRLVAFEEIEPLLEKTMLWFKENAFEKERLGKAIDRIGFDRFEVALLSDDLLARKAGNPRAAGKDARLSAPPFRAGGRVQQEIPLHSPLFMQFCC